MRKYKLHITAIFLLLVFAQGMGMRLMLHNKYHKTVQQSPHGTSAQNVQITCDCLDEALMPLTHVQPVEIAAPVTAHGIIVNQYIVSLSSYTKIFRSLRAPPVA